MQSAVCIQPCRGYSMHVEQDALCRLEQNLTFWPTCKSLCGLKNILHITLNKYPHQQFMLWAYRCLAITGTLVRANGKKDGAKYRASWKETFIGAEKDLTGVEDYLPAGH
ncbi:hypothetical protein CHARACLAT_030887 [Characodon lateralis]|uniref:Uncharacterized protein n=1 Tax=Characodon lateralis TaxID=208331 RepID=A0ABU7DWU6_9TELE|nr:hypothetical protein [Characodon lateralis]